MSLQEWIESGGRSKVWVARTLGRSRATIHRILSGGAPSLELALDIEDLTQGVVRPRDLVGRSETTW